MDFDIINDSTVLNLIEYAVYFVVILLMQASSGWVLLNINVVLNYSAKYNTLYL